MSAPVARRGEVWFAEVPGDKRRPVLILTRDPMGRLLHSVICAPITTTVRGLATEVQVEEAGLVSRSVANFDNTLLLARTRLVRRLGRASDQTMHAACKALVTAAGCDAA
ncbi:MAG: type II toxin-antitoxin system PemK/MazF family toxin [Acidimicrobiia bacterium]|nr:type II toxin-antitoxin system PemK/MazF family toxin [Acidimicrobiia bacterium]